MEEGQKGEKKGKEEEEGEGGRGGRRAPQRRVRMSFSPRPARGIPAWLPPSGALPESQRGGYFGWQHDWELEKQEIEW